VVECTALEMRRTCKGIVGSNPTLSANKKGPYLRGLFYWRMGRGGRPAGSTPTPTGVGGRLAGIVMPAERSEAIAEDEEHALSMFRAIPSCPPDTHELIE
jgi:hypothetical protein